MPSKLTVTAFGLLVVSQANFAAYGCVPIATKFGELQVNGPAVSSVYFCPALGGAAKLTNTVPPSVAACVTVRLLFEGVVPPEAAMAKAPVEDWLKLDTVRVPYGLAEEPGAKVALLVSVLLFIVAVPANVPACTVQEEPTALVPLSIHVLLPDFAKAGKPAY